MQKSIILFGGSFDPIHNGHISVANYALKVLNAEKVIYIPAKNPRWKQVTDVKNRLEMLKIALEDEKSSEISTVEIDSLAPVSYSVETCRYFRQIYKDRKLYFLIGFDQLDQLDEWHEIDEMCKIVQIVAFARRGYPKNHEFIKKYNVLVIETIKVPVSSTQIRSLQSLNTKLGVINYIIENDMYFTKSVRAYLSKSRYDHSVSVARTAYDIAKANNLEPSVAYLMGLLHDIAKELDKNEAKQMMSEIFPEYIDYPAFSYHQWLGSYIVEDYFNISNPIVLEAIKYHTTGKKIMSTYDKILYAADKIEPLRGYDSKKLIEACKENLEYGWIDVLKDTKEFFISEGIKYEDIKLSKEMFDNYLKGDKNDTTNK